MDPFEWKISITYAVRKDDASKMDELLNYYPRQSIDFLFPSSPLTEAVTRNNMMIVEQLLNAGASVNFPYGQGKTPLMEASYCGHRDICQLLLEHGATLSDNALPSGSYQALALLLEHRSHLLSLPACIRSPVDCAIWTDHHHVLSVFLDHCTKTDSMVNLESAFFSALILSKEKCALTLLQFGYNPCESTYMSNVSCFHKAAENGLVKLMKLLVTLNPYYMQENWLVVKDFPTQLKQCCAFVSWLVEYRKQPTDLVMLCKATILSQLGPYYKPQISKLPLPKALKSFLAYI